MKPLVLATQNLNKLREVKEMLGPLGFDVMGLADVGLAHIDIIEDGETFEANALKKAKEIADMINQAVLADDSGLMVDALDGSPGVYSARYSGEGATALKNNEKLLEALSGTPKEKRQAKFVCVMAYVDPEGLVEVVRGESHGIILDEMSGQGGFGYDPLFYVPALNKTYAELQPQEKNQISHRAKALEAIKKVLEGHA